MKTKYMKISKPGLSTGGFICELIHNNTQSEYQIGED